MKYDDGDDDGDKDWNNDVNYDENAVTISVSNGLIFNTITKHWYCRSVSGNNVDSTNNCRALYMFFRLSSLWYIRLGGKE